jgi:hypothetical protein
MEEKKGKFYISPGLKKIINKRVEGDPMWEIIEEGAKEIITSNFNLVEQPLNTDGRIDKKPNLDQHDDRKDGKYPYEGRFGKFKK